MNMKATDLKALRASLLQECKRIESMYYYTFQLEKAYLLIDDFDSTGLASYLEAASNILDNYDYSAKPF